MGEAARSSSGDPAKDIKNEGLSFVNLLVEKFRDELVGRLSELADDKIGRLNFHFAAVKLGRLSQEAQAFGQRVVRNGIRRKRNHDVSHKELPERWSDHRYLHIPYHTILRTVAAALRLMKKIDRSVIGPASPYLWREVRKRRYNVMVPPRVGYLLLPEMFLSGSDRLRIVMDEVKEGTVVWSEMTTTVNETPARVFACKRWGVIVLGDRLFALERYPLQELQNITTAPPRGGNESEAATNPPQ